jgi:hypothetical protein
MKMIWIVLYCHRFGSDVWLRVSDTQPDLKWEAEGLEDFEEREDEWLEVFGPYNPANFGLQEIPYA